MDDPVDMRVAVGQGQHRIAVGDVAFDEAEAPVLAQRLEAGEFQDRVVIGAEIIDADDLLAPGQQCARDLRADEAGDTSDKNGHEIA